MRLLALLVCLLASPALAADTPESVPVAAAPSGLAGVWALDAAASDNIEPLLAAVGRGSMERAMARRIKKVTHTIQLGDGWMEVQNTNPFRTQTRRTVFGVKATVDTLGQAMEVITEVVNGRVVSKGLLTVSSTPTEFTSSRGLTDADTMDLILTLGSPGGEPIVIRRIFRKQS